MGIFPSRLGICRLCISFKTAGVGWGAVEKARYSNASMHRLHMMGETRDPTAALCILELLVLIDTLCAFEEQS